LVVAQLLAALPLRVEHLDRRARARHGPRRLAGLPVVQGGLQRHPCLVGRRREVLNLALRGTAGQRQEHPYHEGENGTSGGFMHGASAATVRLLLSCSLAPCGRGLGWGWGGGQGRSVRSVPGACRPGSRFWPRSPGG